jgi:hypothetical protein
VEEIQLLHLKVRISDAMRKAEKGSRSAGSAPGTWLASVVKEMLPGNKEKYALLPGLPEVKKAFWWLSYGPL